MYGSSRGLASTAPPPVGLRIERLGSSFRSNGLDLRRRKLSGGGGGGGGVRCCCADREFPVGGKAGKIAEKKKPEEWRIEVRKKEPPREVRMRALPPTLRFSSPRQKGVSKQEKFSPRCTPRHTAPQSRDTPPKRGAEKSGKNAEGDSWWETWQEDLYQNEWSNLARIERSAQKQAKSGAETAGWYEKWWEKYDAKGWTEKGAHKYGRLNEQSWWEKWGEHYDGRGSVLKWTDKWAETELGTKWGDKWEEKFFAGIGSRQGETWHVSTTSKRWSRTWGEEHFGNGKVHKYGKSTTGESWDIVVDEETYYEAEPHYGWADVVGNSTQLLSIQPQERPPGVYASIDFGSSPPPGGGDRDDDGPPSLLPPPDDDQHDSPPPSQ
ncbi:hypothetical protein QJS04_geneDACA009732 [Acorus gramineus]|uniref:Uncharacterized protein n=1 Tax=Acorus gramineus TaxID=55184 RepID=A0AAV9BBS5_ACOGR|nr:hypothetical protein QJS04_geneDACA009732 [Acorus gramineus]